MEKRKLNTSAWTIYRCNMMLIADKFDNWKQESLADAKVSARQQCEYEDP